MSESIPSVDVIVPCYRYAHLLTDCVNSVLDQPGVNVRVLVIDDASPDETESVARELMEKDSRVEYRKHEKNRGHIDTYNEGIDWLSADYALLLSADDVLAPGALHRATKLMEKNPDVALTYGKVVKSDQFDRTRYLNEPETSRVLSGSAFLELICNEADNIVPTPTAIVRTKIQKQIGGYRHDLPHAGDLEMWLRFAAHGSVGMIDAVQGFYRVHGQNMSLGYPGVRDLRQQLAAFEYLFETFGARIENVAGLRALLHQRMAERAFWAASHAFDAGDAESCNENRDFAAETWPAIRSTAIWNRLRCKRAIGSGMWSRVRPIVNRMRRRSAVAARV